MTLKKRKKKKKICLKVIDNNIITKYNLLNNISDINIDDASENDRIILKEKKIIPLLIIRRLKKEDMTIKAFTLKKL